MKCISPLFAFAFLASAPAFGDDLDRAWAMCKEHAITPVNSDATGIMTNCNPACVIVRMPAFDDGYASCEIVKKIIEKREAAELAAARDQADKSFIDRVAKDAERGNAK